MMVWLGKNWLGQRDNIDVTTEDKGDQKVSEAFKLIRQLKGDSD